MGLIYLDACLLIYLAERHGRWGVPVADAIGMALDGEITESVSKVTLSQFALTHERR